MLLEVLKSLEVKDWMRLLEAHVVRGRLSKVSVVSMNDAVKNI